MYIENNEEQQLSKKLEDFLKSNVQSNEDEKAILAFLNAIKNSHANKSQAQDIVVDLPNTEALLLV